MWRKNRSPESAISCASSGVDDDMSHGVDLNRNFDYVWMCMYFFLYVFFVEICALNNINYNNCHQIHKKKKQKFTIKIMSLSYLFLFRFQWSVKF